MSNWPMRFAISMLVVVAISFIADVAAPADREPDKYRRKTHKMVSCQQSVPALTWANNFLATKLPYHVPCPGNTLFSSEQVRLVVSSHC